MNFLNDNFISQFLVSVLNALFTFLNDYSLCIIVLTLAIRFVLLPLDLKQRKSTRMMSMIAPEVDAIKKRYANNPDQLNRKIKELYKQNNVSTAAGCLPMLIQLPLLFAFFGALRVIASEQSVSIILNAVTDGAQNLQLPQWLWVHNFWQPDSGLANILPSASEFLTFTQTNANYITPQTLFMLKQQGLVTFSGASVAMNEPVYTKLISDVLAHNNLTGFANGWFGLPVIAGASLFLQQRLQAKSQPANSQMNSKVMLIFFPLFSVYICATSNASFSLYWVMSNVYSFSLYLIQDAYFKNKAKKNAPVIIKPKE